MYNSSPNQIKYAALRREISEGFAQIKRGEYTEYDEHTIKDLAADIKDRGMKRLAGKRKTRISGDWFGCVERPFRRP